MQGGQHGQQRQALDHGGELLPRSLHLRREARGRLGGPRRAWGGGRGGLGGLLLHGDLGAHLGGGRGATTGLLLLTLHRLGMDKMCDLLSNSKRELETGDVA